MFKAIKSARAGASHSNALGWHAEDVTAVIKGSGNIPVAEMKDVTGIPADLLRRRPDVRVAERKLAEQTARIGIAKSDYFPKLTLSGSIGVEALSFNALGDAGNDTHSFGPGVRWAIFHMGSIRNNIKVQKAVQEQALAAYEKAVLVAVQETRDALTAFQNEQQRMTALEAAAAAARTAAELADDLYKNGLEDFQTMLEAQRARLSFEDQLVQSQSAVTQNLINLYKALGGGWESIK